MRFTWLFSLLLIPVEVFALDARILVDESSKQTEVHGSFKVQCLKQGQFTPCIKKYYDFPSSHWKLSRESSEFLIQSLKSKKVYRIPGESFYLTGKFNYKGREISLLHLHFDQKQTQWIVYLPVDQYLQGVLAGEVPASWPKETLKAQAIASRTYFLYKKLENRTALFDVRSDTMDQVFRINAEKHQSIVSAVNSTQDLVLVSKKNQQVFPAYFHSDCGGHTSNEQKVWRKPSALNAEVKDPYCQSAPRNNWSYYINKSKLMLLLQQAFYLPKDIHLEYILPRIGEENRAHIIDFLFSNNDVKRLSANELRKLIGFTRLKSTQFSVVDTAKDFVFTGKGFGHGVGMCQWGAQRWANQGKNFRQILKHYYPSAKIDKISDLKVPGLLGQLDF